MNVHIKYPIGVVIAGCLMTVNLLTGAEFRKSGTAGFVFLEMPVTARSVGLGQTGITLPDANVEGLFVNPALTALGEHSYYLHSTYARWFVETTHQAFGFVHQHPVRGAVGVQMILLNFGEMEQTRNLTPAEADNLRPGDNNTYFSEGQFSAEAYALGLTYARRLTDKFACGANLKFIRETVATHHAENIIADLGFLYQTGFSSLRVGANLQNFGLEAAYANEKFKMPQRLILGLSGELWGTYTAPNHLTWLVEAVHPNDANEQLHCGLEVFVANLLFLRSGYKFGYDYEKISFGLGTRFQFKERRIDFDLAYMRHTYLESSVRYSLSMEL